MGAHPKPPYLVKQVHPNLEQEKEGVEIILYTDGKASITDININENITLIRRMSVIIPSSVKKYRVEGKATLYKASVHI